MSYSLFSAVIRTAFKAYTSHTPAFSFTVKLSGDIGSDPHRKFPFCHFEVDAVQRMVPGGSEPFVRDGQDLCLQKGSAPEGNIRSFYPQAVFFDGQRSFIGDKM